MVSAYIITYNDEETIRDAIRSLKFITDDIVVAISNVPYHGEPYKKDKTEDIALEEGCIVIHGSWKKEKDHRNAAMLEAEKYSDMIIPCEPDMVWEKEDLLRLLDHCDNSNSRAFKVSQVAYWKDRKHIILGDKYQPVVLVRRGVRVTNCANVDVEIEYIPEIRVHHYNWCAPKDIQKKVLTYHHAPQISRDWYSEKYCKWVEGTPAEFPDCTLEVIKI